LKKKIPDLIDRFESCVSVPIMSYIEERKLFILITSIITIGLIVYWDFFTFQSFYFFKDIGSDTLNASYPRFVHTSNYLREWGFPAWSFQMGMGQNFLPFSLGDPFNWIIYLLGEQFILPMVFYVEFSKILLSGILFYLYMKELNLHPTAAIIGGIYFAYCSYLVVGGSWFQTSTETVCAAILLLALELYYKRNNWFLIPVAFMMIAIYLTFWLYFYTLFTGAYITIRILVAQKIHIRNASITYLKHAAFAALGVLMGSILFFPNILQYLESPRVGGDASYVGKLSGNPIFQLADIPLSLTTVFRFFSNDLQGTGSGFYGWYNYFEAPMLFCGLLSLLLFSQIFKLIPKYKSLIIGALVLFGIVPLVFPYFRHLIWVFTGDYFRTYSFFLTVIILISSMIILSTVIKNGTPNRRHLFFNLIVFLMILFLPQFFKIRMESDVLWCIRMILVLQFVILMLFTSPVLRNSGKFFILLTAIIETILFTGFSISGRAPLTHRDILNRNFYNDETVDAVQYLQDADHSFYRIEKNYSSSPAIHGSINDGLAQHYLGTSSYDSFNQIYYVRFLEDVNIIHRGNEIETRWALGLREHPLLQSLLGVKYFLTTGDTDFLESHGYTLTGRVDSLKILFNNYYLPLGFTFDKFITHDEFQKLKGPMTDALLLETAVLETDADMELYPELQKYQMPGISASTTYTSGDYQNDISLLRKDTLNIESFNPNHIVGRISTNRTKILFFSVPFDEGWNARVDEINAKLYIVDTGFMGLILPAGDHKVELLFEPRFFKAGYTLSGISILIYISLLFIHLKKQKRHPARST